MASTNRAKYIKRLRRAHKGLYKRPKWSVSWAKITVRPVLTGKETVPELRAMAKTFGFKNYSKLPKAVLVDLITNAEFSQAAA